MLRPHVRVTSCSEAEAEAELGASAAAKPSLIAALLPKITKLHQACSLLWQ